MRKLFSFVADAPRRLMAGAAAGALATGGAGAANAQGIGTVAQDVQGEFQGVVSFIVAGAFLIGVGFCAAGLLKLKAAADSQGQQVKYSEGLWRLGVGASLIALPMVTGIGKDTLFGGTQNPTPDVGSITIGGGVN